VYATAWAQACKEIPALGTTHADYAYGSIPCTRQMKPDEIKNDYETNTGKVIVERFNGINPLDFPGVLVASHGPFTWGKDAHSAVESAVILEFLAKLALQTF
jgi:L-ribulose-5-phosphate 4-epimerase